MYVCVLFSYNTMTGLDVRRKNATRESTSTLKAWLFQHIKNPYPTKGEKIMLAIVTRMTLTQVWTASPATSARGGLLVRIVIYFSVWVLSLAKWTNRSRCRLGTADSRGEKEAMYLMVYISTPHGVYD